MSDNKKIGFIGFGLMGAPMAKHLLAAGFSVFGYVRNPEKAGAVKALGVSLLPSPKQLAEAVDVLITIVTDTNAVDGLLHGDEGILAGARSGLTMIDMSTISAEKTRVFAKELQAHQVDFLDAPVSGGEQGAIAATLSIMVGGPAEVLARMQPILEKLGQRITHVGEHGAGQVTKSCNQVAQLASALGVSEAFALAKAQGVDLAKVREALLGGFAASRVLEVYGQRMIDDNFAPGFFAELYRKDMRLALEDAQAHDLNLPVSALGLQCLNTLVAAGQGKRDAAAIALVIAMLNPHLEQAS